MVVKHSNSWCSYKSKMHLKVKKKKRKEKMKVDLFTTPDKSFFGP